MLIGFALVLTVLFSGTLIFVNIQNERISQVYVGVTYGGDSVADAEALIDKVKGYTNLFVLASGLLQRDLKSVNEIGDYAVAAGMYFLPYFGNSVETTLLNWINEAKQKWGPRLLGIYSGDESGGKMLDSYVTFDTETPGESITKTQYNDLVLQEADGTVINYRQNGQIDYYHPNNSGSNNETVVYSFNSDGIINQPTPTQLPKNVTYQSLLEMKPFKNPEETAKAFISNTKSKIDFLRNTTQVFTSDYALIGYGYLAGYDVVLGQIGWNNSLAQQIGFLRGAAAAHGKDWGIVATWKYNQAPYLDTGENILQQFTTAYECGAKYFVFFNFYEQQSGPYGTIKEEHFKALESFWNGIVKNCFITRGSIKATANYTLPEYFGGGLRWRDDTVWGIFAANNESRTQWDVLQEKLLQYGTDLDIVFGTTQ